MAEIKKDEEVLRVNGDPDHLQVIDQTAHLLGNYHKYYSFHSVESRISLVEKKSLFHSLWKAAREPSTFYYLDIGCNEGDLSLAIYRLIRAELPAEVKIVCVGADIDGDLIKLAREKTILGPESTDFIYFENIDFTDSEQLGSFRKKMIDNWHWSSTSPFHLISVFSTTMWIHINHGDEGLKRFFIDVKSFLSHSSESADSTNVSGALLVEPQPPKCYTNAARRCRKLRINYPPYLEKVDRNQALQLLANIIQQDLHLPSSIFFGQEMWGRALSLYFDEKFTLELPC